MTNLLTFAKLSGWKIIPEFSRIKKPNQFDRYHALTVGQHTLKALTILKNSKE